MKIKCFFCNEFFKIRRLKQNKTNYSSRQSPRYSASCIRCGIRIIKSGFDENCKKNINNFKDKLMNMQGCLERKAYQNGKQDGWDGCIEELSNDIKAFKRFHQSMRDINDSH